MTRAPKMLEDDLSSAERKEQIATGQQPALRTVDRRRKGICTLRARETVQKLSNFSAAVANCSRDRTATEQTADRLVKKCHSRRRQAGELDRFYGAPSAHLARARVPIGPSAARVKKPLKATWTNTRDLTCLVTGITFRGTEVRSTISAKCKGQSPPQAVQKMLRTSLLPARSSKSKPNSNKSGRSTSSNISSTVDRNPLRLGMHKRKRAGVSKITAPAEL